MRQGLYYVKLLSIVTIGYCNNFAFSKQLPNLRETLKMRVLKVSLKNLPVLSYVQHDVLKANVVVH